ncbi:MAG: hypothetical protein JWL77_2510 [Chthonomonadaceae bacterium]|nr:hypothetical protein [Chthonomonadaceae bacterium]
MINATLENLLTYSEVLVRQRAGFLRASEIPVEFLVSLPMPTLRSGEPGFALFAAPTSSAFRQPVEQGPPDRWWTVSAKNGHLLIYAFCRIVPIATETTLDSVTMPPEQRTVAQIREDADAIEQQMNALAPLFFAGEAGEPEPKKTLLELLTRHLKEPVLPYYRALAPDFFAWLGA